MFQKSLEGQKWSFSKKFRGPLGYVLASSLVSKSRSEIQKSWPKIKKIKCFSEAPESYLNSFALIIKFRARFSHRFMHFLIFHIFDIFHIFPLHRAPKGPFKGLFGVPRARYGIQKGFQNGPFKGAARTFQADLIDKQSSTTSAR